MLLKEVFEYHKDRKFMFVEPGGNHGDFLIHAGAKKLANELGIKYTSFSFKPGTSFMEFLKEVTSKKKVNQSDVIYLHGSGGFNSMHNWSPTVFKNIT